MKRFKFVLATTLLLLVTVTACDESMLDISNPNEQTSATFWQTQEDAVKATNAVYEGLTYEGMYMRFLHVVQELRADDTKGDSPWGGIQNVGVFNLNSTSVGSDWTWRDAYHGIFRANQVITNVPDIEMDEDLKARLIGEAKFLRAHFYFKLVKLYHNVPLILKPAEGKEDFNNPQAPPEEVWAQIIKDLKDAQAVLPEQYSDDKGRATWGAATAYLGKAYLFTEQWDLADTEFKKIIDSGLYGLVDNYRDNGGYENENNKESIFEIQFDRNVGGTDIGWAGVPGPNWGETQARSITWAPIGYGWADVEPTRHLYDEFKQEKTVNGEDDPRMGATIFYSHPGETVYGDDFNEVYSADTTQIFWRKYEGDIAGGDELDMRSGINFRVMRYADVLLMYAETRNELGDQVNAAKYIQIVRDRANLPDREAEFATLSQQDMRDRIAHERFLELAGEGKRFDDIRRWGWLQDSQKLEQLKQNDPEFEGYAPGREWLPIPQGELDTNPKLKQNPGY